MDKHLLYLEIIFLFGVIINILVEDYLFLKILFIFLLFLFVIKEKEQYNLVLSKYYYVGFGLCGILVLFIVSSFINNIYFLTIFICLVVIYFYLYKVLFNISYGVVVSSTSSKVNLRITDSFYKSKKIYTLPSKKKYLENTLLLVKLSNFPINKKPIEIIKEIKEKKPKEKKVILKEEIKLKEEKKPKEKIKSEKIKPKLKKKRKRKEQKN